MGMFLFFPGLLFIGFYEGLFALLTGGVFPAASRWNFNRFVYDKNDSHRRVAQVQVLLAVLGTAASLAMFFFYPE